MTDATRLPDKTPGEHRWAFAALIPLTDTEAAAWQHGAQLVRPLERMVVVPLITCYDCNGAYTDVARISCPSCSERERDREADARG